MSASLETTCKTAERRTKRESLWPTYLFRIEMARGNVRAVCIHGLNGLQIPNVALLSPSGALYLPLCTSISAE